MKYMPKIWPKNEEKPCSTCLKTHFSMALPKPKTQDSGDQSPVTRFFLPSGGLYEIIVGLLLIYLKFLGTFADVAGSSVSIPSLLASDTSLCLYNR